MDVLWTKAGDYWWRENWITIPQTETGRANGRTHAATVSRDGSICVFHQAVPAVLVYSPSGVILNSWGDYPGAHGMTLVEENGEEFLWLVDQQKAIVENHARRANHPDASQARPSRLPRGTRRFPDALTNQASNGSELFSNLIETTRAPFLIATANM